MKVFRASFLVPLLLFVAAMTGATMLQTQNIARWRKLPFRFRDTLYLPSSDYVKAISLGYDEFVADFIWLRMIQTFAGAWTLDENADQMMHYFEIVSDLDPKFTDVYTFAVMAIGEEGKHTAEMHNHPEQVKRVTQMVLAVINKGVIKDFGAYAMPFAGAFYAFWDLNQPTLAKYYVRMAKKDPNYPTYIDRWEAYFDLNQGRYKAAYQKFLTDYVHGIAANNKEIYPILSTQLNRAVNQWFIDEIRQRAEAWRKAHGALPSVEELDRAGAFKGVTLPDWSVIKPMLDGLLDGTISANKTSDEAIERFAQAAIRTTDHLPPGPYDFYNPRFKGYVIWRTPHIDSKNTYLSKLEAVKKTREAYEGIRIMASSFRRQYKRYPSNLEVFAPDLLKESDPFGGKWTWDAKQALPVNSTIPDIDKLDIPEF